jgi:predicted CopG family antitoxin
MSCKFKNIAISKTNYLVLKQLGRAGDSFNDVISELLNKLQDGNRLATMHHPAANTQNASENASGYEL